MRPSSGELNSLLTYTRGACTAARTTTCSLTLTLTLSLTLSLTLTLTLTRYVHRGAHYHLQLLSPSVDNPDQRIATELELWSSNLAALLVSGSQSIFNILFYSLQTWIIMGWQARLRLLWL